MKTAFSRWAALQQSSTAVRTYVFVVVSRWHGGDRGRHMLVGFS